MNTTMRLLLLSLLCSCSDALVTSTNMRSAQERRDFFGSMLGSILLPDVAAAASPSAGVKSISFQKITEVFSGAISNPLLVKRVTTTLRKYGFRKEFTLMATSLCCDEVTRALEQDFAPAFGSFQFRLGGLAGFPFAGATGFQAMSAHIPDDGCCFIVYGPHCGVNSLGQVGTVPRKGKLSGGSCCGSAKAAADYVMHNSRAPTLDPLDFQQHEVVSNLLPYVGRIRGARETLAEVSFCLYEAQDAIVNQLLQKSSGTLKRGVRIALLGGIQINTPKDGDEPDYFLPLRFDLHDSQGADPTNLLLQLNLRPSV